MTVESKNEKGPYNRRDHFGMIDFLGAAPGSYEWRGF